MIRYIIKTNAGWYASIDNKPDTFCWDWVSRNEATLFNSKDNAQANINKLQASNLIDFNIIFSIIQIDIDDALKVLRDLYAVHDLGDYVYDIRERECKGWHGPLVIAWDNATARARKLLDDYEK